MDDRRRRRAQSMSAIERQEKMRQFHILKLQDEALVSILSIGTNLFSALPEPLAQQLHVQVLNSVHGIFFFLRTYQSSLALLVISFSAPLQTLNVEFYCLSQVQPTILVLLSSSKYVLCVQSV